MGSCRNNEHIVDSTIKSPAPNIGPLFCLTTVTSHFLLANLAYKLHHAMNVFMRCDVMCTCDTKENTSSTFVKHGE